MPEEPRLIALHRAAAPFVSQRCWLCRYGTPVIPDRGMFFSSQHFTEKICAGLRPSASRKVFSVSLDAVSPLKVCDIWVAAGVRSPRLCGDITRQVHKPLEGI